LTWIAAEKQLRAPELIWFGHSRKIARGCSSERQAGHARNRHRRHRDGYRRARRNAILGSAIGYATDGFDLLILGFMLRLALTQTAGWTVATIAGMAIGIFVFGQVADRVGRRAAFFSYMTGAAVMVLCYSRLSDPTALLFAGMAMGFFVNGMLGGYGALMSELYPTPRAPPRRTCCSTSAAPSAASVRCWSDSPPPRTASSSRSRRWRCSMWSIS
jgi:hypothetical protein